MVQTAGFAMPALSANTFEGKPCLRCGGTLRRVTAKPGGRCTYCASRSSVESERKKRKIRAAEHGGARAFHGAPCRNCDSTLRDVLSGRCIACRKQAVTRHLTAEKRKEYKLKYKGRYKQKTRTQKLLSIDHETFALLLTKQDGRCAICGVRPKRKLHIDHCHSTGRFRGLLCSSCNTGIGLLRDSPAILRSAINYLENNEFDL